MNRLSLCTRFGSGVACGFVICGQYGSAVLVVLSLALVASVSQ